jgi:hypothetical protein
MGWHRARERSTLRQPDHSVFGRMISCSARYTDQAADRGAVYDRAASLLAHLAQLVLHAVPDAAEIDRNHSVEIFATGISGFRNRALDASIVERRIQPAKGGHGLLHHSLHLRIISHIAACGNGPVTCADQLLGCFVNRSFVHVRQHYRGALRSECLRRG